MHASLRRLLPAVAASLLLALAVGTTSARSLSVSAQGFRMTWGILNFTLEGFGPIRCPLTLEGSFHGRTFSKVAGTLVGAVTRAGIAQLKCTNGTATPTALPWHLTYASFAATLPQITAVNLLLSRLRFAVRHLEGTFCTGQYGTSEDNVVLSARREAGGGLTEVMPAAPSDRVTLFSREAPLCPERASLEGVNSRVAVLDGTTRISVTLI
jgi:hypothetical protein